MDNSTPHSKDLRRTRRYKVDDGRIKVYWLDASGQMKITRTRALNISEEGIALKLPREVMPLLIRFQSERYKINGVGTVRYCRRSGSHYIVGVEFAKSLRWCPPEAEVSEPIPVCGPDWRR